MILPRKASSLDAEPRCGRVVSAARSRCPAAYARQCPTTREIVRRASWHSAGCLPEPFLIANALAPNHPLAEAVDGASLDDPAIIVIVLLYDATPTFVAFVAWLPVAVVINAWSPRTNFNSDLSLR
jgi:hypothetical protein